MPRLKLGMLQIIIKFKLIQEKTEKAAVKITIQKTQRKIKSTCCPIMYSNNYC